MTAESSRVISECWLTLLLVRIKEWGEHCNQFPSLGVLQFSSSYRLKLWCNSEENVFHFGWSAVPLLLIHIKKHYFWQNMKCRRENYFKANNFKVEYSFKIILILWILCSNSKKYCTVLLYHNCYFSHSWDFDEVDFGNNTEDVLIC